jgi:tRNA A-37 threonylcarbamoyl transferase component Bud32/TolB-like protein
VIPGDTDTTETSGSAASCDEPDGDEWIFPIGERVAGRYRIVRPLAQGGMGQVYEAEDLMLKERVALKVMRPGYGSPRTATERFRREAQLARRVTHPGVCRLFDVGTHRGSSGREDVFLTMELIHGETLAARIRRDGPLAAPDAEPIVAQLVAALAVAHRAGVVHRDLKSGNVMLTGGDGGRLRVVVTDFGLAKAVAPDAHAVTQSAAMLGSPAYMSPEQVQGRSLTAASDVYSLGVVLYEMLTGVVPFTGETPFVVANRRLTDRPRPPRDRVATIDARWNDAILRCLAVDPARRFARVEEILEAIHGRTPRRRGRFLGWIAASMAAAGVAAAVGVRATTARHGVTPPRPPAPAAIRREQPAVAVLGFRNLSGRDDTAWLSTALAELVTTELDGAEGLRPLPMGLIASVKRNLTIDDAEPDGAVLAKLRGATGASFVVGGSYVARGDGGVVEVSIDVHDTTTGARTLRTTISGTESSLVGLAQRIARRLLATLGGRVHGSDDARAAAPSDPAVARLYFEAVDALRAGDYARARTMAERAAALAPADPLVQLTLGRALTMVGTRADAIRAFERAHATSGDLTEELRLSIEARLRAANGDAAAALAIWRRLSDAHPGDVEYAIALSSAQAKSGDRAGARATSERVRRHAREEELVEIDLMDATDAAYRGDHALAAALCEHAADLAGRQGAHAVVAQARARSALARFSRGDLAAANRDSRDVRAFNRSAIGRDFAKNTDAAVAVLLALENGDPAEALRLARLHEQSGRERGDPHSEGRGLDLAAAVLRELGDPGAAGAARRAIDVWSPVCESCTAIARVTLAELALDEGRIEAADEELRRIMTSLRGAPSGPAAIREDALRVLALSQLRAGHRAEADITLTQASVAATLVARRDVTWRIQATRALVSAASGREAAVAASHELARLAEEARDRGFLHQSLLMRLQRLEALERAARDDEAAAERAGLEAEAAKLGFLRIARAARAR